MTNEDEYDEIVNFIDTNMTEYNDGSLSIPEVVEDLHKRFCKLADESSEMYALLSAVIDEVKDYQKLLLSTELQKQLKEYDTKRWKPAGAEKLGIDKR